ncbi:MAG: glycogen debranching protein GlgX [Jiangellaceae bacterium]|nr:glycogen debranching protein GlgX [Jiangellaceae bacterium]
MTPVSDDKTAWPGLWSPLGATFDGEATNVALWAPQASKVEVCLFDGVTEETRILLADRTFEIWHGRIPDLRPGVRYGLRVHGPWEPDQGKHFDPAKLLLDPYARAVTGELRLDSALFEHGADSAPFVPMGVVVGPSEFDWSGDVSPRVPWGDTVVYEMHVRGFTMRHPDIPEQLRGTFAGLADPAAIQHLLDLGVTTVELMPVHHYVSETHLLHSGRKNYWGYNTVGFFAPHAGYAASGSLGQQVDEFKAMVKALHSAGIEVVLDVVYNHTAEEGPTGPTLSFRGIDNLAYYRQHAADPGRYYDYTGCGNTVDVSQPHVLRLVMDSLRYWAAEMHVDGFRFDLAAALARSMHDVDMLGSFMTVIEQDPVLREVKLIAEPWDIGPGGYQVGEFPHLWTEWNDRFRDTVRDYWRGQAPGVRDLAYRLSGSSDLYGDDGRRPYASINFVTAHDGFTLRDVVSYDRKHNEANGEHNRDGTDSNRSWNHGVEGETSDRNVLALRHRQLRNLLTTLLLSTGVPMLLAGDEMGRTQQGNNNAYCIDDDTTWLDWSLRTEYADLLALTRRLISLRRAQPVFRQRRHFDGLPLPGGTRKDLAWFARGGAEMTQAEWHDDSLRTISVFFAGDAIDTRGPHGERIVGDSFLLCLHADADPVEVSLPSEEWAQSYQVVFDTTMAAEAPQTTYDPGDTVTLTGRSILLLRATV